MSGGPSPTNRAASSDLGQRRQSAPAEALESPLSSDTGVDRGIPSFSLSPFRKDLESELVQGAMLGKRASLIGEYLGRTLRAVEHVAEAIEKDPGHKLASVASKLPDPTGKTSERWLALPPHEKVLAYHAAAVEASTNVVLAVNHMRTSGVFDRDSALATYRNLESSCRLLRQVPLLDSEKRNATGDLIGAQLGAEAQASLLAGNVRSSAVGLADLVAQLPSVRGREDSNFRAALIEGVSLHKAPMVLAQRELLIDSVLAIAENSAAAARRNGVTDPKLYVMARPGRDGTVEIDLVDTCGGFNPSMLREGLEPGRPHAFDAEAAPKLGGGSLSRVWHEVRAMGGTVSIRNEKVVTENGPRHGAAVKITLPGA